MVWFSYLTLFVCCVCNLVVNAIKTVILVQRIDNQNDSFQTFLPQNKAFYTFLMITFSASLSKVLNIPSDKDNKKPFDTITDQKDSTCRFRSYDLKVMSLAL